MRRAILSWDEAHILIHLQQEWLIQIKRSTGTVLLGNGRPIKHIVFPVPFSLPLFYLQISLPTILFVFEFFVCLFDFFLFC